MSIHSTKWNNHRLEGVLLSQWVLLVRQIFIINCISIQEICNEISWHTKTVYMQNDKLNCSIWYDMREMLFASEWNFNIYISWTVTPKKSQVYPFKIIRYERQIIMNFITYFIFCYHISSCISVNVLLETSRKGALIRSCRKDIFFLLF